MTIDEAISHALEVAEQEECFINYPHSDIVLGDLNIESHKHYAAEQRQLAEWLKELKELRSLKTDYVFFKVEAKKLLRAAVEDFSDMNDHIFDCDGMCDTCPIHGNRDECDKWRYADEALKLIKS
jgi:hypothetical protein